MYNLKEKLDYGDLATFVPNKKLPVYNWFYYKEGFSAELVFKLIERFSLKPGNWVLDPFCGIGTTMLTCKQLGINSIGYDVLPVAVFAAKVKLRDYSIQELKKAVKELLKLKFKLPKISIKIPIIRRVFSIYTLQDIVFFKENIAKIKDKVIRNFLLLGLMNASMKCSYAWKDGAVIKIKKRHVAPLRLMLRRQLYRMIKDLENFHTTKARALVDWGDARRLKIEDSSIDSIITSPPYLNKIEYTKVYTIEEWILGEKEKPPLRSCIGLSEKLLEEDFSEVESIVEKNLPLAAKAYFKDMFLAIKEMYRVCKEKAKIAIVVGNGCFPDRVVESDIILSKLAEKVGFKVKEILVLNKRWCTRERVKKVGIARESLLIWEKI